jgi:phage-related protein
VAVLAYAAAQAVMNAVMWANPIAIIIGLIVLLIAALVAAVIWVANNTEAIGKFFADMWAGIQDVVAAVAGWFQAVWGAVCAWFMGIWASVAGFFQGIWTGILAVVNSVIAGIRAVVNSVVQFFVSAWTNAVNMVNSVIRTLQAIFTSVFNAIMVPINAVVGAFNAVIGAIKNVISWLGKIKIPDIFGAIGGMMGGRSVSVSASAAPAALSAFSGPSIGALTTRAVSAGGGTVINVNGGLDSADAIARRIQQLLRQRDQRAHGVTITRSLR